MAEMIIHLEIDPETQKKNITIKYRSDEDALPMEHEEAHQKLVDQLIEGGALSAAEVGEIQIERIDEAPIAAEEAQEEEEEEEQEASSLENEA
jgi:hypothetical protein